MCFCLKTFSLSLVWVFVSQKKKKTKTKTNKQTNLSSMREKGVMVMQRININEVKATSINWILQETNHRNI